MVRLQAEWYCAHGESSPRLRPKPATVICTVAASRRSIGESSTGKSAC
ncbi:MAG TPA: hypothetical protein ACFYD6_13630 [Candidatus Brocadiia bacterium]|nr:hypothetical protein [Candidatus Brocadiales bacterium]